MLNSKPMPLPELHDPDVLTKDKVDDAIRQRTAGFYVLGTLGDNKIMSVSYVGRSDDDLAAKLKRHVGNYAAFAYATAASALLAYHGECRLYHALKPSKNVLHPMGKGGPDWACPVCGQQG
jgi:anti-sigma-K factor RskA